MKDNGKSERRRPIEREYLTTLNRVVSLDKWRAICQRAADDAEAGDVRARDWLARWLLETENRPLTVLAAEEAGTSTRIAAKQEIADCRQKLDDGRAEAELLRELF